jgi:2-dehydro-3-deoxygalactonokinase
VQTSHCPEGRDRAQKRVYVDADEAADEGRVTIEAEWIAVDWGTSNLRVWGIGADGGTVFSRVSDQGMSKLTPDAYPSVLSGLLAGVIDPVGPRIDVLVCGMAGARQGWLEAPYLDAPADLGSLASGAVAPPMPSARLVPRILPGICQRLAGAEDVMRGEETQLLGLAALYPGFSGVVCMPGTHSKWVELNAGRVERFATVMTGELFEVLRTHSVLRHSFAGPLQGPNRAEGFEAGLAAGIEAPHKLSAMLFKVRAGSLLSGRTPDWCAGFLSGLLIGSEIGAQRELVGDSEIAIVGDTGLGELYSKGLAKIGGKAGIVDGIEATLAGLKAARQQT